MYCKTPTIAFHAAKVCIVATGTLFSTILLSAHASPVAPAGRLISAVSVKASSDQNNSVKRLIDGLGLTETGTGTGVFVQTNDKYANGATMWNAAARNGKADYHAWLVFDLGKTYRIRGLHVWNFNENYGGDYTGRGVKQVVISASITGKVFSPAAILTFQKATGQSDDTGEEYPFPKTIKARLIKFQIKSNYMGRDVPGLSAVQFRVAGAGQHRSR